MPIDPRIADLTAINAALEALSYVQVDETLETDALVIEAVDILIDARSRLTDKRWPERPPRSADLEAFEAWHAEHSAAQREAGLQ